MTKALSNDDTFVDEIEKTIDGQRLVRQLFALRCAARLTQTELAEKLGWSQSQVSRLEHDEDRNVTVGEIEAYLGALGLTPSIVANPAGRRSDQDGGEITLLEFRPTVVKAMTKRRATSPR